MQNNTALWWSPCLAAVSQTKSGESMRMDLLRSSANWTLLPVIRWTFFSVSSPKSSNTSLTFFSKRRTVKNKNTYWCCLHKEHNEACPTEACLISNKRWFVPSNQKWTLVCRKACLVMRNHRHTLCISELLSKSIGCDGQHPLDPPEQNHIIALKLEHREIKKSQTIS